MYCDSKSLLLAATSALQLARYSTEGLLQLGPLGSTTFLPDTKCLVDDGRGRTPRLKKCEAVSRNSQRLWDFTQVKETSPPQHDRSNKMINTKVSKFDNGYKFNQVFF